MDSSLLWQVILYALLGIMGLYALAVFAWQVNVIRGKPMRNCDGTDDDWHEQKIHYGIAFADLTLACPVVFAGIALVFVAPAWGHFLLSLASFWFVWSNIMTTSTSVRFEKPTPTLRWFIEFPSGALVGLAYLVWVTIHCSGLCGSC